MTLNLIHTKNLNIHDQLILEESLIRTDNGNWCLINEGSLPAIILGISGKPHELINMEHLNLHPIPCIRRFSGGGTVIVDENTLFITFIFQKEEHPFPAYPEPIMRWSESLYKEVFATPFFALRENDYVLNQYKCGGNAQYIKKNCWLLHTSFLWDFKDAHMLYLSHPKKTPTYRHNRSHTDFLCRLKDHFPCKETLINTLKALLASRYTLIPHTDLPTTPPPNRLSTVLLPSQHPAKSGYVRCPP